MGETRSLGTAPPERPIVPALNLLERTSYFHSVAMFVGIPTLCSIGLGFYPNPCYYSKTPRLRFWGDHPKNGVKSGKKK